MTFRKITLSAMVAIAIAAFTGFTAMDARAQASATDNADINAVIANPITLANTGALDFGEISPSAGSTTLVVATDSSTSGDAVTVGGTPAAASFNVTGLALRSYTITLPASTTYPAGEHHDRRRGRRRRDDRQRLHP